MRTLQFFVEVYFGPEVLPETTRQVQQLLAAVGTYNPLSVKVFAEYLRGLPEYRDLDEKTFYNQACYLWGALIVHVGVYGRALCAQCYAPFRLCSHELKYYVTDRDWLNNVSARDLHLLFQRPDMRRMLLPFVWSLADH